MSTICTIATAVLNQWALDFKGNYERILESILEAKKYNSKYRGGPELEVCGYGCGDHFYEYDTLMHSWEVLNKILEDKNTHGIILDIGMPVGHKGYIYNCRVICLDGKVKFIRPKQVLAIKGVFREDRWFSKWNKINEIENFVLPDLIRATTGQINVPIGDGLLYLNDTVVAIETCHELWVQESPNIKYFQQGAEFIFNGNGSNHVLRKMDERLSLLQAATKKNGGIYVYTNLRGCDSERVYYDGGAVVSLNGNIVSQSEQFSVKDVEVLVTTVDMDEMRTYRYLNNSNITNCEIPKIEIDFSLTENCLLCPRQIATPIQPRHLSPEEEVSIAPSLWLWDNLRRSGMSGFFLPLSGGLDSSSVACIVHSMCIQLVTAVNQGGCPQVLADIQRIVGEPNYIPTNPKELCSRVLVTCYMATEHNSQDTKNRAANLAKQIGSCHLMAMIDTIIKAILIVACTCLGIKDPESQGPRFSSRGGSRSENLALQNVQARIRMVLAYLLAQLYYWSRNRHGGGLLVLASGNLDECLRGYLTKYDCSSADLNPIGSICKDDLRMFIRFCIERYGLTSLSEILDAPPTAELEPLDPQSKAILQTDEMDMGITYTDLSLFGKLRKIDCCGPYSMFVKLLTKWSSKIEQHQNNFTKMQEIRIIAEKVRHFFICYSKNRHKMTVITPSYHLESYDCDDNRFDLRPYLYNTAWTWQFDSIGRLIIQLESRLLST